MNRVENILKLVDDLRDRLIKHKFKATSVAIIKERIENADEPTQIGAESYLLLFRDKYLNAYDKALELAPPLVRTLYEAHGGKPTTFEEKVIAGTKKDMIEAWKARPFILTRKPESANVANARRKNQKPRAKLPKSSKRNGGHARGHSENRTSN